MSIFDEITEQEWKAPRKTIFDDITPEEINPQPVDQPSWVQNLSAMGGDDPSFYTPSEQTVRPGQFTEGVKDVARTGLKGVSALYEFAGGDSAIKRGLSMVPGLKGASALMEASSKPVVKVAEGIANKPELQPDPSMAPKNWGEQFIRTAPQVGTQIVASIVNPAIGVATIASQIVGGTYEYLISKGVPKDKAAIWGLANAAMQAPLEQLGINKALKYFKAKGKIVDLLKSAGTEFVTEWAQSYPDAFVNIFAPDSDKRLLDKTKEYLEKLPETTKQGIYEGSLTAPFAILPGAVNLATKGEVESEAPGLTSDQILAGLNNKTISVEQANAIKQSKPEYADIVDQALSEFQSTDTEKAKREFVDPVKVARERNQSIMDSVDLDVLSEADQSVERQQAKKQEAGIAEEAAIADRTTTKRRFKALSEIWDTLSDDEQDKAIELILPKTEPASITAERQQKAEAQTFERTGVPSAKRAQDAETILAGLKRFNIKLSPDEQARLETEAGKKQDQDLKKVGVWTEPSELAQEPTAPVPSPAEPAPSQAPPTSPVASGVFSEDSKPTKGVPNVEQGFDRRTKRDDQKAERVLPDGPPVSSEGVGEDRVLPQKSGDKEPWELTYDELKVLISPNTKDELEKSRYYLASVYPEQLNSAQDPWGIKRAVERGDEIPRTPLTDLSVRHKNIIKKAIADGRAVPEKIINEYSELKDYATKFSPARDLEINESKPAKGETQQPLSVTDEKQPLAQGDARTAEKTLKPINDLGKSGRRQLAGAYGEVGEVDSRTVEEREAQGERRKPKIEIKKLKDTLKNEKGSSQLLTDVINVFAKKQTDSPEFKKWFGDSKVVDDKGRPLVVYHGSNKVFDAFDPNMSKSENQKFYFTDSPWVASRYHGNGRTEYLNVEDEKELSQKMQKRALVKGVPGASIYPVYLSFQNPKVIDYGGKFKERDFRRELYQSAGHDGLIIKNIRDANFYTENWPVSDIYIAFEPTQIKSALGNTGAFDPNNPSIIGTSQLINDIAYHGAKLIRNGVETFARFRREMKVRFKEVWEKIKPYIRGLWDVLNNERGQVDVWHGSPHQFDKFSTEKIGTGEGGQAFGWGLYFTDKKEIAEHYQSTTTKAPDEYYLNGKPVSELIDAFYDTGDDRAEVLEAVMLHRPPEEINKQFTTANGYSKKVVGYAKTITRNNLKAEIGGENVPLQDVYGSLIKATLHEGKGLSEYTWMDWEEPADKKILEALLKSENKNFNQIAQVAKKEIERVKNFSANKKSRYATPEVLRAGNDYGLAEDDILLNVMNDGDAYRSVTKKFPLLSEDEDWAEKVVMDVWGSTESPRYDTSLGEYIYKKIAKELGGEKNASLWLRDNGIDGIRYQAGTISGFGEGTNYVVFDENAVTIKEINGKLLDALKNEKGSSQLITDISSFGAEQIRKGVSTFREFRASMKERFADIWDKIKEHMRDLWNILNNQRGEIKIERQESIDDLIAKLQKAEPKKEVVQHESGDGWYDKISAFERPINDLTAWLADKNHPISVIQRRLKSVRENIDVFLRETQRPKVTAAKIEKMWTDEVEPLLEDMANSNITLPDLEEYAHAIHAPEANEKLSDAMAKTYLDNILNILPKKQTLALRNEIADFKEKLIKEVEAKKREGGPLNYKANLLPKHYRSFLDKAFKIYPDERVKKIEEQYKAFIKKPSGMTDADALAIQKKWKGNQDIERLRQRLKDINSNRLDILYDAGLVADEEYEAIKAKYKDYVPLYREGYDDSLFGPSRGLRPAGRPIKTRMGSNRNVVNILAHSIANYEKAINLAEKARSTEALKNLVLENPDPELWSLKKEKKSPRHDNYGNVRMYPDLFNVAKNEMRFMVGGKQWILEVNKDNKDAMNMLKTLKAEDSIHGWALNQLARLNRILARVNTSWSPEFVISNFARDLQTAGINIKDTGVKSKSMISGALKAAKSIWRVERGKQKGTEYEKLYERFKTAGGKIGWADVHSSIENLSKKLTKEIETLAGKRPTRRLIKQIGDFVEAGNTSIENGVRLHAFKLAVEQGFSDAKAAQIASDLTVDFTKKGYAGPAINSLYLFANAGIQGSYRIIRAATKSASVRRTMATIFGMGILNGFLNSMAGDDEDGEDYFNKIEDYIKERNAIFMLPGTKGKYVKIPLPWGYNLPWATGVEFSRVFTQQDYKPMDGAMRVGSTFVNAFNPIQSGTLMQTLAPTVADPFVMVAENKNWFGGPLMPDQNQFDKVPKPDSQRYWRSSRVGSRMVAEGLNSITGGDKVKPGLIDVSPETIDLVVDTLGGSMARFWSDIASLPMAWVKGEEIKLQQYPFVRRVAGQQSEYTNSQAYFKNVQDILTVRKQLETYRGTPYYDKLLKDTKDQQMMFGAVKGAESILKRLRKRKRRAEASGNDKMVKEIEKRIDEIYIKFNKRYYGMDKK